VPPVGLSIGATCRVIHLAMTRKLIQFVIELLRGNPPNLYSKSDWIKQSVGIFPLYTNHGLIT